LETTRERPPGARTMVSGIAARRSCWVPAGSRRTPVGSRGFSRPSVSPPMARLGWGPGAQAEQARRMARAVEGCFIAGDREFWVETKDAGSTGIIPRFMPSLETHAVYP